MVVAPEPAGRLADDEAEHRGADQPLRPRDGKKNSPAPHKPVPAIVAKLPFWNVLEHQIRRVSVKVGRVGVKGFAGKHFRLFEHRLGRNGPCEAI